MKEFRLDVLMYLFENFTENTETMPTSNMREQEGVSQMKAVIPIIFPNQNGKLSNTFSTRVYTCYEIASIGTEVLSFLLQLEKFGILTEQIKEEIIDQLLEMEEEIDADRLYMMIAFYLQKYKHVSGLQMFFHELQDRKLH